MATGAHNSKSVACIILAGDDFPAAVLKQFGTWNMSLVARNVPNAKSTRGLLEYLDDNFGRKYYLSSPGRHAVAERLVLGKVFRYLTPPLQPTPEDLEATGLLESPAFHILAAPEELRARVQDLRARRTRHGIAKKAVIVWEPAPPHCVLANRDAHIEACKDVDVFSPNHLELMALFEEVPKRPYRFHHADIAEYAKRIRDAHLVGSTEKGAHIVIRAGEHGCFIMARNGGERWLPPFYDSTSPKIVDPTGAGNAFLGALTVALQDGLGLSEAAILGSVASSFALEQIGLPTLGSLCSGAGVGAETWNDVVFAERLEDYRRRIDVV